MDPFYDGLHVESYATAHTHDSITRWYGSARVTAGKDGQKHSAVYDFGAGFDTKAEAETHARQQGERRAVELARSGLAQP